MVRFCILVVIASAIGPAFLITLLAAGLPIALSGVATACVLLAALIVAWRRLPAELVRTGKLHRLLFGLWVVLSLVASYRLATISVFMLDVERSAYAFTPKIRSVGDPDLEKPFYVRHNCFTAAVVAAHLASNDAENIYDPDHYRDAVEKTAIHDTIGEALSIDTFQYPPPFLLVPRLLLATGADFFQIRTVWFALNILLFTVTVGAIVVWVAGYQFHACWFAWPLVLAAPVTLGTLQIENAHFFIVCLAVLAMVAFEKQKNGLGGVLLAFSILSKIFPGVLLAYLVVRRRWGAVVWTGIAMVVLSLTTLLVFGLQPFESFVSFQLPRLASGEAFAFATEKTRAILLNQSILGAVYKLDKLGLMGGLDAANVAKTAVWIYTVLLVAIVVYVGLKHRRQALDRDGIVVSPASPSLILAQGWVVLLILGQLRNPFLPWGYGNVAVLLLVALLIGNGLRQRWWSVVVLVLCWLAITVIVPLPFGPATGNFDLVYTLAALALVLALSAVVVFRRLPANVESPYSRDAAASETQDL